MKIWLAECALWERLLISKLHLAPQTPKEGIGGFFFFLRAFVSQMNHLLRREKDNFFPGMVVHTCNISTRAG
jgi:hypothetical protein